MPKKALDGVDVSPSLDQMRGVRAPTRMRRSVHVGSFVADRQKPLHGVCREPVTALRHKKGSGCMSQASFGQVNSQGFNGTGMHKRHLPVVAALRHRRQQSDNFLDLCGVKVVDVADGERCQLHRPQAHVVREHQDGLVSMAM